MIIASGFSTTVAELRRAALDRYSDLTGRERWWPRKVKYFSIAWAASSR